MMVKTKKRMTTTPLPQLIYPRVVHLRRRVKECIYTCVENVVSMDMFVGPISVRGKYQSWEQACAQKMERICVGDSFSPATSSTSNGEFPWTQRWFRIDICLPPSKITEDDENNVDICLEFVAHGEFTVYTDKGDAWCGIDPCHSHIPLSSLLEEDGRCRIWLDGGQWQTGFWFGLKAPTDFFRIVKVQVQRKDEVAYQTYHDVNMLLQWVEYVMTEQEKLPLNTENGYYEPLTSVSPSLRRMLHKLNQACDIYDQTHSLSQLQSYLQSIYTDMTHNHHATSSKVCLVGHAHIDLVWLWPEQVTYQKAIHTYSTVLQYMKQYPTFKFTMSQPPLFYHILKQNTKLASRIKHYIQNGQWEFTGALEVEADTQLPVGEGLIRCIQYGQERIHQITGKYSQTCWIPDVFGYTQCLPQLLALAEIPYFFTTKILWSTITKFPHNSFVWQSPDVDSSVLAHLSVAGYNGKVSLKELIRANRQYQQADVHNEILCPSGYGDGGGGPTQDMIEQSLRMQHSFVGSADTPSCHWDTVESFFHRLQEVQDELPVYQGELFLEYHRGVHTTQSNFKYQLRSCERSLQIREAMRVISANYTPLDSSTDWERYLFALFHDAIPGSSIQSVYQDLNVELETLAHQQMTSVIQEWPQTINSSLRSLSDDRTIIIANPLAWTRHCIVELPDTLSLTYEEDAVYHSHIDSLQSITDGTIYPTQIVNDVTHVCIPLPGLSALPFHPTDNTTSNSPTKTRDAVQENDTNRIKASPTCLDNGIVCVTFNEYGMVDSMMVRGEPILLEEAASFTLHSDHPEAYDAWDMDHHTVWMKENAILQPIQLQVVTCGPVLAILQSPSIPIGKNNSHMLLQYKLCAHQEALELSCTVDWRESHSTLRYQVPTKYNGTLARFGAPFNFVDRVQIPQSHKEEAQWEVPASRWASILNGSMTDGLSIITQAKYGFRAKQGILSFTLLRSPTHPDPSADIGHHTIQWSLARHSSLFPNTTTTTTIDDNYSCMSTPTAAKADELYTPFVLLAEPLSLSIPTPPIQFTSLNSVVPSWIMPSNHKTQGEKEGFCVRLHEISGCHTFITFTIPIASYILKPPMVQTINLRDTVLSTLNPNNNNNDDANEYRLPVAAYKIITLRILF